MFLRINLFFFFVRYISLKSNRLNKSEAFKQVNSSLLIHYSYEALFIHWDIVVANTVLVENKIF